MTHIGYQEAAGLAGRPLVDRAGTAIGTITGPIGAPEHGDAAWLAVDVAGTRAVIPVVDLGGDASAARVPYSRQQVLEAPGVAGDAVETAEDHALRAWYGLPPLELGTSEGRHQYEHQGLD